MSFRLSTFRWLLAAAISGGVELLTCPAVAQPTPPLGISGVAAVTNSPGSAKLVPLTKKDGLTAFEEELSKSLQILSPKSSLDGVLAPEYHPPPAPVVPNRRPRDSQDRRKELLLMNAEDLRQGKPGEEWLQMPGMEDDPRNKSSLADIYQKFNRQGLDSWNGLDPLGSQTRPGSGNRLREDDDSALPGEVRQAEEKLKKQLGLESRSPIMEAAPVRGSLSDFFGFGERGLSREQVQANKTYIEQYQQMLNASSVPSGGSLNPGLSPEITPAPAYRGLDALSAGTRPADAPTSARSRSSVLDPFRLPDPNKAVTQWDPLYEPPKIEPARPTSLFTPPVEAPRRRF